MELPRTIHNRLSYAGAAIAALGLVVFGFLLFFHAVTGAAQTPYAGIVIFMVVPGIILLGVILLLLGMLLASRRIRRTGERERPRLPVLDLNLPRHRNLVLLALASGFMLLFLSVFGGYQAYETTESVAFCGQLCHAVMEPEFIAYRHSPHARVPCVDCHVGSGASWFARSKLSGLYQVYAVAFDTYPRPIPAPIESLRPARDTCEQCHWPQHFYGEQHRQRLHFLADEANTRWRLDLRVKTGGGLQEIGHAEGIHWHMSVADGVEYFARDAERQDIPWVRVTDRRTGVVTEYVSQSAPPGPDEIAHAAIRTMDCMDCHNRPTHIFRSPSHSVDGALAAGLIDPGLPFVKKEAVELLAGEYASRKEGLAAIAEGLRAFYRKQYPEVAGQRSEAIEQAAAELQVIYRRSSFPRMKVRWDTYADNAGHLDSRGCFRCHDADHRSADGRTLERPCDTCHLVVAQGPPGEVETAVDGLPFRHPVDVGETSDLVPCSDCHTGALP
jgi:NapC/NirT cytochrome c family, N-terminal region